LALREFNQTEVVEVIRAIPTEYDGIRYRSKTEAIFARCIDIIGMTAHYEPKNHSRLWDFEICPDSLYRSEVKPRVSMLIELKPIKPTLSYAMELREKIRPSVDAAWQKNNFQFASFIVFGGSLSRKKSLSGSHDNFYKFIPLFPSFENKPFLDQDHEWKVLYEDGSLELMGDAFVKPITHACVAAAQSFRFDLAHRNVIYQSTKS
jgi:hypothetical protein